jgi:hypothetical protein
VCAVAVALAVTASQAYGQMVVTNDTLPDSKQVVRDVLVPQRDSLHLILAAAAQLRRGNATASVELLFTRGRSMLRACTGSATTIQNTRTTVEAGGWDDDLQNRRKNELLAEMDLLDLAIVQCNQDWTRLATLENAEEIRTSGLASADSLVATIHRYENVVAGYYKVLDIYVEPPGGNSGIIP